MADARDALVSITFRPGVAALVRQWEAQAREIRAGAQAAHVEAAERMQATALEKLRREIAEVGRVQRDTKYLERAVESPEFIHVDAEGFTFATEAFKTDPTISSYWRGIEFGSRKFVGRTIHGFFRDSAGRAWPASPDRFRMDPRLIQTKRSVERRGHFPFDITIRNPIPEHNFLRSTIEEYEGGLIDQIYRRHLGRWMR